MRRLRRERFVSRPRYECAVHLLPLRKVVLDESSVCVLCFVPSKCARSWIRLVDIDHETTHATRRVLYNALRCVLWIFNFCMTYLSARCHSITSSRFFQISCSFHLSPRKSKREILCVFLLLRIHEKKCLCYMT